MGRVLAHSGHAAPLTTDQAPGRAYTGLTVRRNPALVFCPARHSHQPPSQTIEFPQNKIYGRIGNYLLMADGRYIINLLRQKTTFSLIKR